MATMVGDNIRISDSAVMDYVQGNLSPAKHFIINCQKKMSRHLSERIEFEELVASRALAESPNEPVVSFSAGDVLTKLPKQDTGLMENEKPIETPHLDKMISKVSWRRFIGGISIHNIMGTRRSGGERLYLFNAKPGTVIPEHSHRGDEWVLVLQGSYTSNGETFRKGDMHIMSGAEQHSLEIGDEGNCICLAMTEDKVKMRGFFPRIGQILVGL